MHKYPMSECSYIQTETFVNALISATKLIYVRFTRYGTKIYTGNTWQWLCIESATTTATETYDPTSATGCNVDSITLAMLCSRRTFHIDSNVENSSSTTSKSAPIVSTKRFISLHLCLFYFFFTYIYTQNYIILLKIHLKYFF